MSIYMAPNLYISPRRSNILIYNIHNIYQRTHALKEGPLSYTRILSVVQSTKFPVYRPLDPQITHGNPML